MASVACEKPSSLAMSSIVLSCLLRMTSHLRLEAPNEGTPTPHIMVHLANDRIKGDSISNSP